MPTKWQGVANLARWRQGCICKIPFLSDEYAMHEKGNALVARCVG